MIPAGPEILLSALALDLLLGDPRWLPHPVVQIGRLISFLEPRLRRLTGDTRFSGILLLVFTVSTSAGFAWLLLTTADQLPRPASLMTAIIISYTCLAARCLHTESADVATALLQGNLEDARRLLSYIVGRDTDRLEEPDIWRALVETVAENTCDGIIAPLFWLALGGPVAGIAYKAVSTLDSMVGYRNERHIRIGWASARMDDLLNFIPARITAILMILSAPLAGLSAVQAIRTFTRDRFNHPSPNSGHPEAAAAGALKVRLGGPASYNGVQSCKQYIGDPLLPLDERAYRGMIRLMYLATVLMFTLATAAPLLGR